AFALVLLGFVLYALVTNGKRWLRVQNYVTNLQPNCLLTRYPIVLVTGHKSILNFAAYWDVIPRYLRDHGYEVIELPTAWRLPSRRRLHILQFLEQSRGRKFHFIFDKTAKNERIWLDSLRLEAVKSTALVNFPVKGPGEQDFLCIAISLAE